MSSSEQIDKDQDIDILPQIPLKKLYSTLSVFLIVGIIFGAIAFSLHYHGNQYNEILSSECPNFIKTEKFLNISLNYNLVERIINNQYRINSLSAIINRKCPSKSNDINIFIDDVLAMRTETLFDSHNLPDDHKFNIYDCHKNLMFQLKYTSPIEIFDNENTSIGIIREDNYKGDKIISVFDRKNKKIAKIYKNDEEWRIEIYEKESSLADWRVISAIFGKLVLLENDICNAVFNFTGIISVIFVIISLIMIVYLGLSTSVKKEKKK